MRKIQIQDVCEILFRDFVAEGLANTEDLPNELDLSTTLMGNPIIMSKSSTVTRNEFRRLTLLGDLSSKTAFSKLCPLASLGR